jgi:aminoglycoside phosphotransferase (APT) family kinase protein
MARPHGHDGVVEVHSVVAACMPDYRIDSVVPLGEGLDNVAYEVNGELIVRFSKEPDPMRLDREARLLAAVAAVSPPPVPEPTFTVAELGCMAYVKLPGTPLLDVPQLHRSDHDTSVAAALGEFLAALHAVPTDRVSNLVDTDDQPLAEWRREAAAIYPTVVGQIPSAYRRPVEAFLDAAPPDDMYSTVFPTMIWALNMSWWTP